MSFPLRRALLGTLLVLTVVGGGYWRWLSSHQIDPGVEEISQLFLEQEQISFPELQQYRSRVASAREQVVPVLNVIALDNVRKQILEVALAEPRFLLFAKEQGTSSPYRNEIFAVRPARFEDAPSTYADCAARGQCWVVELYNFSLNLTSLALVDAAVGQVRQIRHVQKTQPEVPEHLQRIAEGIALHSSSVRSAAAQRLKIPDLSAESLVMSGTKTALNRSRCERSQHLCVAPTLVKGDTALWFVVDLTDEQVVGVRQTRWTGEPAGIYTEGRLRDASILSSLCAGPTTVQRGKWKFSYSLTNSDGLNVVDAEFNGNPRFLSYKNVDWHVSYSNTDGFGYSDAVGCPLFSAAAVVPAELAKFKNVVSLKGVSGVELHQDFLSKQWPLPCNYYYEQRTQLFEDGSFRLALASVGRGCGDNGTYRPVMRIVLPEQLSSIERWNGASWEAVQHEGWFLQSSAQALSPEGFWFRFRAADGKGFGLVPGTGQFGDGGRGDNAFVYFTKLHPERDEGRQDMPTIGPCCNNDFRQGPEKFIDQPPEELKASAFALWYVPQLKNEGTPGHEYCWGDSKMRDGKIEKIEYPCIAGPLFEELP